MIRVDKAIKKVVALGAGATMLGATLFGAMAADLSDYPSPFVKDGKFNAKIVIGEKAATSDVLGAIDIANSLQHASRVAKPLPGSAGTTTVDGGVSLATSGRDLYMGDNISASKQVLTDADLPNTLKKGSVITDDGTYSFTQQINLKTSGTLNFADLNTDDSNDPYINLNWASADKYTMKIVFPQAVNFTSADNEEITIFGKTYTISGSSGEISQVSGSEKITLYTSSVDKVFTAGESATVSIGGTAVDVSVSGANSDQSTAVVTVNGETKSVSKGSTYTIGGQKVYVNDVFVTTVPTPSAAVRLFIGSKKVILEEGNAVQIGDQTTTDVSGTYVDITSSNSKISEIAINVTPAQVEVDSDTRDYLKSGDEFVDPVFGTFKIMFTGIEPALDSAARDTIKVQTADPYTKLTFTNRNGVEYNGLRIAQGNTTSTDKLYLVANNDPLVVEAGATLNGASGNKEAFILDADGYSAILRLDKVYNGSTEDYIKLYDYGTGQTTDKLTVTSGTATYTLAGRTFTFTVDVNAETATVSPNNVAYVYTKNGAKITLMNSTGNTPTEGENMAQLKLKVDEETAYNDWSGTPDNSATINLTVTYAANNSDNDMRVTTVTPSATQTSDSNKYELVTNYGTFVKHDTNGYDAEIYYPASQVVAGVFIAPAGAATTSSGGSAGGVYYETARIQVGAAVLDTSVLSSYQDSNLIVVGGPCVNTVSAKLRNNPTNCAEGFKEGEAIIKLYDTGKGNVALLVAGMSAADTVTASQILAQANSLGTKVLSGTEVKTQTVTESVVTVQSA